MGLEEKKVDQRHSVIRFQATRYHQYFPLLLRRKTKSWSSQLFENFLHSPPFYNPNPQLNVPKIYTLYVSVRWENYGGSSREALALGLSFAVFFCLLLSLPSFFFCPSLDSTRSDEPRGATIAKASRNQLFLWIFDEVFRFGLKRLLIHQARIEETRRGSTFKTQFPHSTSPSRSMQKPKKKWNKIR